MRKRKAVIASLLMSAMLLANVPYAVFASNEMVETENTGETEEQVFGSYKYTINADEKVTLTAYTATNVENVEIPGEIDGKNVTAIADDLFKDHTEIKSIVLPDFLESIGASAFENTGISEVRIPCCVNAIGTRAFYGCAALMYVEFEGEKPNNIGKWIFGLADSETAEKSYIPEDFVLLHYQGSGFDDSLTESWTNKSSKNQEITFEEVEIKTAGITMYTDRLPRSEEAFSETYKEGKGNNLITGTVIAGVGEEYFFNTSYDIYDTAVRMFDGDVNTYFDPFDATFDSWGGVDCGEGNYYRLTKVCIKPRKDQAVRYYGGTVQGSNDLEIWYDIFLNNDEKPTNDTDDGWRECESDRFINDGCYRYFRYVNQYDHGDIAELELYGEKGEEHTDSSGKVGSIGRKCVIHTVSDTSKLYGDSYPASRDELGAAANGELIKGTMLGIVFNKGTQRADVLKDISWDTDEHYCTVDKMFDGDPRTYYDSPNYDPLWVNPIIICDKPYKLTEIRMHPRTDYDGRVFTDLVIQGSNDLNNWYTIYHNTKDSKDSYISATEEDFVNKDGSYRFFRLSHILGNHTDMAELELYGVVAEANNDDTIQFLYTLDEENNAAITQYIGAGHEDIVIPAEIDGHPVTAVGERAFTNIFGMKKIIISDGITTLMPYSLQKCGAVEIVIPASVTTIGDEALSYCSNLETITVDSGNENFIVGGDRALYSIDMKTLYQIPFGYYLENDMRYEIPNSVESLASGCMSWYYEEEFELPESVKSISHTAFSDGATKKLIIRSTPEFISDWAFNLPDIEEVIFYCNAPDDANIIDPIFGDGRKPIIKYAAGTTGWTPTWHGLRTEKIEAENKEAESIVLDKTELSLEKDDTAVLTATVKPDNAQFELTWKSSNSAVAEVDENGKITAKGEGVATITVSIDNGRLSDSCSVTVKAAQSEAPMILLSGESTEVKAGSEFVVEIRAKYMRPFSAALFSVTYDNNAIEFVSFNSERLTSAEEYSANGSTNVLFLQTDNIEVENYGLLATLKLKVKEEAKTDTYFIRIEDAEFTDSDDNEITVDCSSGLEISVDGFVRGDVNNDKKVNLTDVSVLLKYLNGYDLSENGFNAKAADVNDDGEVDVLDLVKLKWYLIKKISILD